MIKPLPVNQGRKTEWVKSRLLSYIHDNDMKSGDKIPPVRELCEVLQVGSSSVFRAVKSLCDNGVLTTRDRQGVFVANCDMNGFSNRSVAVIGYPVMGSPYNAVLYYYVSSLLLKAGCRCDFFEQSDDEQELLVGLKRKHEQNVIDAVIILSTVREAIVRKMREMQIPFFTLNMSPSEESICAITYDFQEYVEHCLQELRRKECERIVAFVGTSEPERLMVREYQDKVPSVEWRILHDDVGFLIVRAREIAEVPPAERPDGLVFFDDVMAMRFCAWSRVNMPDYEPAIATLCNREVPLELPYRDVLYYEVNEKQMVEILIEQLFHFWKTGEVKKKKISCTVRKREVSLV